MIRSENLRSGYIQDDVEEYLYEAGRDVRAQEFCALFD